MNDTLRNRFRQTLTALVALTVVASVLGPVGTVAAQEVSVTQSESTVTTTPGETVTLTTTVDGTDVNGQGLQVSLPAGWQGSITDAAGGAPKPESGTANVLEVVWLSNGTYEVTYEVQVPADASDGDYTVTAEGSGIDPADSSRVTDVAETTITVQSQQTNDPPTADAGSDQTVDEGTTVTLDATGSSDPDGSIANYAWTQTGGPSVSLSDAGAAQPTFTAPDVDSEQTLTFEVEVTDDDSANATDTVAVTVQDVSEPPADSKETAVRLEPSNGQAAVGGTTEFDLVVANANGGVGAYDATVSVADVGIGEITDVELKGNPAGQTSDVSIAGDGSSASISAALMDTADTGNVTVATLTVTGVAPGTTDLSVDVGALGDEAGTSYTVTGTSGATLTVTEKSTTVSLAPSTSETTIGETTTFDLVVDDADGGVGAYTATVALDDPAVGQITDVQLQGSPAEGTSNVDVADDGSAVTIDAALMDTADSGDVTVATITVEGTAAGSANLSVSVDALGDESGTSYAVTGTNGATLTITEIVVGDYQNPVSDPDDDGEYEDVNGDDTFDIVDVQALFANLDDDAVQNNPEKFDFNDDGTVDIVDVQALFFELVS